MTASALITAMDLYDMPSDGHRRELIYGELHAMAPTGMGHGDITLGLGALLRTFVKSKRLGKVVGTDTGFFVTRHPDTVLAPDIAFVSNDQLAQHPATDKYYPVAPALAVEVLSPSDSATLVDEKIQLYLAHGTRLVWILNPKRRTVTVYQNNQFHILNENQTLEGQDVIPNFAVKVTDLFET